MCFASIKGSVPAVAVIIRLQLSDKKLINSTKKLNYEKSINNFKMVFPNVKPFRAIDMIAKRCVSKYNLSPTFIFYEICFGYNFKSLESIYHKDPVLGRYKQSFVDQILLVSVSIIVTQAILAPH